MTTTLTIADEPVDENLDDQPTDAADAADDTLPEAATTEPTGELTPAQKLEHEHYEEILVRTQEVCEARTKWASAKDRASGLKKEFDALNGDLLTLIQRGPDMQTKLPLDGGQPSGGDEPAAATVVSDAWRDVEVGELDVPDSLVSKLCENGLHTLGELSDFWKGRRELTELKGIGGAKSDAVADAFARYGQEHPEVFGEPVAVEEPAAENAADDTGDEVGDEESDDDDWEDLE